MFFPCNILRKLTILDDSLVFDEEPVLKYSQRAKSVMVMLLTERWAARKLNDFRLWVQKIYKLVMLCRSGRIRELRFGILCSGSEAMTELWKRVWIWVRWQGPDWRPLPWERFVFLISNKEISQSLLFYNAVPIIVRQQWWRRHHGNGQLTVNQERTRKISSLFGKLNSSLGHERHAKVVIKVVIALRYGFRVRSTVLQFQQS